MALVKPYSFMKKALRTRIEKALKVFRGSLKTVFVPNNAHSEFKKLDTLLLLRSIVVFYSPGLWIRIHFFRIESFDVVMLETNTDPDPIRIQGFNDQKLKKNYS